MIQIDLITGFLGSGKTTFIKKYAAYLMERGQKISILENDFGAVNVDMLLLQDIMGENCEVEMIVGGSDKDTHKRRLKTKLISMGMRGFDRVLIEPSGIFDVDEFFDVLQEEPLDRWYEIGNVIAVVDAKLSGELSRESEYLLASQIANAGRIILSKRQEATEKEVSETLIHMDRVMKQFKCKRRFGWNEILEKDWKDLTAQDFEKIMSCGYVTENCEKLWFDQNKAFNSLYFMNVRITEQELREKAERLLGDRECGHVFRVKGFLPAEEGKWIALNATREEISVSPVDAGQEIIIVIGEGLNKEKIDGYWKG